MFSKHPNGLIAAALANMGRAFRLLYYDGNPYTVYLGEVRTVRNDNRIYLFRILCIYLYFGISRRYHC